MLYIALFVVLGVLWGLREAYHADPEVFERLYGVCPESFWGSEAWKRNYYNNDPNEAHKPELFNTFRDVWHFAGFASKYGYALVSFLLGVSDIGHKVIIWGVGLVVSAFVASCTYRFLRLKL
ncbi:MAG: hypothetical protein KatS3mg083_644 [Candidatus Dojkabacteria bacterium]|nr:MAG: hypothetical protein KatS3mg083_644 [Candidatus Dojkabacteria bacterium]